MHKWDKWMHFFHYKIIQPSELFNFYAHSIRLPLAEQFQGLRGYLALGLWYLLADWIGYGAVYTFNLIGGAPRNAVLYFPFYLQHLNHSRKAFSRVWVSQDGKRGTGQVTHLRNIWCIWSLLGVISMQLWPIILAIGNFKLVNEISKKTLCNNTYSIRDDKSFNYKCVSIYIKDSIRNFGSWIVTAQLRKWNTKRFPKHSVRRGVVVWNIDTNLSIIHSILAWYVHVAQFTAYAGAVYQALHEMFQPSWSSAAVGPAMVVIMMDGWW